MKFSLALLGFAAAVSATYGDKDCSTSKAAEYPVTTSKVAEHPSYPVPTSKAPEHPVYPVPSSKKEEKPTTTPAPVYPVESKTKNSPVYETTKSEKEYTTSVVYTHTVITITSCAPEITDCPAKHTGPIVVTKTIPAYTTICPVEKTKTKPVEKPTEKPTAPVYPVPSSSKKEENKPTKPVYSAPVVPTKSVEAPKPKPTYPAEETVYVTVSVCPTATLPTGTGSPKPSTTNPGQIKYTGAASVKSAGGMLIAAGLAAALL